MKRKDRRVRLFLELFFIMAGFYVLLGQGLEIFNSAYPGNLFEAYQGTIPVFNVAVYLFAGLSCFISAWALWSRISWAAGWSMFTFGMLLYGNIQSIGTTIIQAPAQTIPMILIILVVMQSFPFLIRETRRYP